MHIGSFVIYKDAVGYVKDIPVNEDTTSNTRMYLLDIDGKDVLITGETKEVYRLYTAHLEAYKLHEKVNIVKQWYEKLKLIRHHTPSYNPLFVEGKYYVSLPDI